MSNFYWDETRMSLNNVTASILAIGDSWFWYPFPGGSLINYLGPIVAPKSHVILAKGMNGAEAFDYVDGKYAGIVRNSLRLYGKGLSAVFLSGGGNDFAGFNDLRPLLKQDCSGENTAKGCFKNSADGLDGFLDRMDAYYRKLIGLIYTYTDLNCKIVMHTYDYAIPNGKSVIGNAGWLLPALVDAQVPVTLHSACIAHLLDKFHAMLVNLTQMDPHHLLLVDSRGTLSAADWANELHPKGKGFQKIANLKWAPVLAGAALA